MYLFMYVLIRLYCTYSILTWHSCIASIYENKLFLYLIDVRKSSV